MKYLNRVGNAVLNMKEYRAERPPRLYVMSTTAFVDVVSFSDRLHSRGNVTLAARNKVVLAASFFAIVIRRFLHFWTSSDRKDTPGSSAHNTSYRQDW